MMSKILSLLRLPSAMALPSAPLPHQNQAGAGVVVVVGALASSLVLLVVGAGVVVVVVGAGVVVVVV